MHFLDEIYKDWDNPGSLSNPRVLHHYAKKKFPEIKKSAVENYLRSQESYTLHTIKPNKFHRRSFLVKKPGHTIGVDTAYMRNYSKSNNNIQYLIIFIDLFSRYVTVFPVKTIKNDCMVEVMKNFFNGTIHKYSKLISDLGSEFVSKPMKNIYKKFNVEQYHTESREIKVAHVERVIRTLKSKIHRYITETNTEYYLDFLPRLVSTYNCTKHRSLLGRKPLDIHLMSDNNKILEFNQCVYKYRNKTKHYNSKAYDIGQYVRLKTNASSTFIFRRSFNIRNTREVFRIISVNSEHVPITYNIEDLDGETIKGIFYKQELIPVNKKEDFKIKIIKRRKRKGKLELYVNFVNFPNSKNTWIPSENLVT